MGVQSRDHGAEQHGGCQDDHGRGTRCRAESEAGVGAGEVLEESTQERRIVEGVTTNADEGAEYQQSDKEGTVAPTHHRGRDQGEHDQPKGQEQEPDPLRVLDARLDPGTKFVVAVEEPIPEAAENLRSGRCAGNGFVGFGIPSDGQAVTALQDESCDPPDRHDRRRQPDAQGGGDRPSPRHGALDQRHVRKPQDGSEADEQEAGCIDAPDGEHDQRKACRMAPSAVTDRQDGETDHPGEAGPWQEHR